MDRANVRRRNSTGHSRIFTLSLNYALRGRSLDALALRARRFKRAQRVKGAVSLSLSEIFLASFAICRQVSSST